VSSAITPSPASFRKNWAYIDSILSGRDAGPKYFNISIRYYARGLSVAGGLQVSPYELMFFMAMRDGPAYGYELAGRFQRMTGGHIKVSYGTLYPFLRRMERRGIVRSRNDDSSGRVYYELTRRGREAQERLSKKMKECQKDMEERLLGILAMHAEVFGRKALKGVLKHAQHVE